MNLRERNLSLEGVEGGGGTPVRELEAGVELILEGIPVDRFPALPAAGGVAPLDHEVLDHTMEGGAVVVPLHAQLHKVADSLHGRMNRVSI